MSMKSYKINSYQQELERKRYMEVLSNENNIKKNNIKEYRNKQDYHREREVKRLKEIIEDYKSKNNIEKANEYQEELNKYLKRNLKLEVSNSFKTFKDNLINYIRTSIKLKKIGILRSSIVSIE